MLHNRSRSHRILGFQALETRRLMAIDLPGFEGPLWEAERPLSKDESTRLEALHSNPEASYTLYLDFDGHFQDQWGRSGQFTNIDSPPFDIDGSPQFFNATERDIVREIWLRMSEDWASFDVDVTTQRPENLDSKGEVMHVVFGGDSASWFGRSAGGLGMTGGWYLNVDDVAYVFAEVYVNHALARSDLSQLAAKMANVGSQEAAHHFGLSHQGEWDEVTGEYIVYSTGSGDWSPLMGNGDATTRSTWWNGLSDDTQDQSIDVDGDGILDIHMDVYQDDMELLSRALGYRADDHGNSPTTATPLGAQTVRGGLIQNSGIVEQMSDVDYFSFTTSGGTVGINLNVVQFGPNLDARLELWGPRIISGKVDESSTSAGGLGIGGSLVKAGVTMIAWDDPVDALDASITANLQAGDYLIVVRSHGRCGDVGQYVITGQIPVGIFPDAPWQPVDTLDPADITRETPTPGPDPDPWPTEDKSNQLDLKSPVDPATASSSLTDSMSTGSTKALDDLMSQEDLDFATDMSLAKAL